LRDNKNIKGITIHGIEHKLSQFADDTTILLDGTEQSLNETLTAIQDFSNISGLNVNFDKTNVVWIGKNKYSCYTIKTKWKLNWMQHSFKMLGINFHVDLSKMVKINYDEKIVKMENILKNWKRRIVTPIGKIVIAKTLIVSLFNHLFISLPNPHDTILNSIKSSIMNFIWDVHSKIKFSTIVKEYNEGGLKMINLDAFITALKLTWLQKIQSFKGNWIEISKLYFDTYKLFNCSYHYALNMSNRISNPFWVDVLKSFSLYCGKLEVNTEDFL